MSILTVFQGHQIRFVGTADEPEWVGADVVTVLYPESQSKDRANYLSKVPIEWKGMQFVDTLGGRQNMTTLFAPGLYWVIARSNSPLAVPFQKWVFEEVLPSIQKTGRYVQQPAFDYYEENLSNVRVKREWKEKTEISESQLRVYCFLRDIDRWTTAKEIADATNLHPGTVRAFLVYFRRAGLLDMLESFPRHMHKFSDMAEARNPSFLARLERAVSIMGNPLIKKTLPSI